MMPMTNWKKWQKKKLSHKGGSDGVDVQWIYEGITDSLPIYDELEDGAELFFSESKKKTQNFKKVGWKKGRFS